MFARAFTGNAVLIILAESWQLAVAKPTLVLERLPTFNVEPIRITTGFAVLFHI